MDPSVPTLAIDTVVAITISSLFLIALLVGFSVLFNFPKLRKSSAGSMTVRSLEESMGTQNVYLTPRSPRGSADQLATPELLEAAQRKTK